MPLGDPRGGLFEYGGEGLPESVFAVTIPVSDIERSIRFYTAVLGMELLGKEEGRAYLRREDCRIILEKSTSAGTDTRVYFGTDSPYNTRRRLSDEGVEFVSDPARTPFGVAAAFLDPDGNILRVMDRTSEFRIRLIRGNTLSRWV